MAIGNAKRFPADAVTRAVLAGQLSVCGRYGDALRHYWEASRLDPSNVRFVAGAAYAMRSAGYAAKAITYLKKRVGASDGETHLRNALASILRNVGEFEAAVEVYGQILTKFPGYMPARYGLSAAEILLGRAPSFEWPEDSSPQSEGDWIGFRTYARPSLLPIAPRKLPKADERASAMPLAS